MSIFAGRFVLVCGCLVGSASAAEVASSSGTLDVFNMSLEELNKVEVSIATGNAVPIDKVPSTASVISAAEIEAMGASNLNDVLETVPGLHVSLSSLSRLDSVYSIRGIHTGFNPQVLLLLNGVPVQFNSSGGRPTLFRMPVSGIERVEIIRGPGSAIYGADAFAGVINVITKDFSSSTTEIGAKTGSFGGREFWFQTKADFNDVKIAFNSTVSQSDGDESRKVDSDLQSILDAALGTQASLAPSALSTRYQVIDHHLSVNSNRFSVNLTNWNTINAGEGAGGAQAIDPQGRDDARLWLTDIKYKLFQSDRFESYFKANYSKFDEQAQFVLLPKNTLVPIGADGNIDFGAPVGVVKFTDGLIGNPGGLSRDLQGEWVSLFNGVESHRFRLAVGARHQSLESRESKNFGPGVLDKVPLPSVVDGTLTNVSNTPNIFMSSSERTVRYISIQDEWNATESLSLTSGVRYDSYTDFGDTLNPRLGLVWAVTQKFTTKIIYGSAFRAPSFSELYYKNNPVSLGNRNLKPETLKSREVSFTYLPARGLQATLTLFDYRTRDMIDFVTSSSNSGMKNAQNFDSQHGKGGELEVVWKPTYKLQLVANYSLQDSTNKSGFEVADAPREQFKAGVNYSLFSDWWLSSQIYRIADRPRANGDQRDDIEDYTLVNLSLNRKNIWHDVSLSLQVKNVFDTDAKEPSSPTIPKDYPLESRSLWVGLKYEFK